MFNQLVKKYRDTSLEHLFIMISGSVAGQAISLAAMPLITRIYSPVEFGTFALFASISIVFIQIGTLCYERALLLPRENMDALNVLMLAISILLGFCILVFLASLFFTDQITALFNNENLEFWLYLVPFFIFFRVIGRIFRIWNLRWKRFAAIASSKVAQSFAAVGGKLGLGVIVGGSAGSLIIGEILGMVFGLLTLFYKSKLGVVEILKKTRLRLIRRQASKYCKFAFYGTPTTLLNILSQESVILVLSAFFTPAVVGFYGLANRIIRRPLLLLADSLTDVYHQRVTSQLNTGKPIYPGFRNLVLKLIAIALLPTILLMLLAPMMFQFVFGVEWRVAGKYVQVMSPWLYIIFVMIPSNLIFEVCQRQELRLILNTVSTFVRIGALFLGYFLFREPLYVIGVFIIANFVWELVILLVSGIIAKENDQLRTIGLK